jgi:hypothetical protein
MRALILRGTAIGLLTMLLWPSVYGQESPVPTAPKPESPQETPHKETDLRPGRDRWTIKTAADPDASGIPRKPVPSTVEKLLALPRPVDLPLDAPAPEMQNRRARPAEMTIWAVEAQVVACQLMPDGDYRVTIKGASGQTLFLEMPNPDPKFVAPEGPFAGQIKAAREQFERKCKPSKVRQPIPLNLHARITGIGFFGRAYRARKPVTGNLIQLHPVLRIEWLDKPTAKFKSPAPK